MIGGKLLRKHGKKQAGSSDRREFALRDCLNETTVKAVHEEVLRVLRPVIAYAWIDAYSDLPWPTEVLSYLHTLTKMAGDRLADGNRRRSPDVRKGIDIDVRDEPQFQALQHLLPYTIHAEAWAGDGTTQVLSASDTGTSLWFALTSDEKTLLKDRLAVRSVRPNAVMELPERRRLRRPKDLPMNKRSV